MAVVNSTAMNIGVRVSFQSMVFSGWTEVHDIVQETGIKTIPMEKKGKKAKWPSEEGLQIAVKRREV